MKHRKLTSDLRAVLNSYDALQSEVDHLRDEARRLRREAAFLRDAIALKSAEVALLVELLHRRGERLPERLVDLRQLQGDIQC